MGDTEKTQASYSLSDEGEIHKPYGNYNVYTSDFGNKKDPLAEFLPEGSSFKLPDSYMLPPTQKKEVKKGFFTRMIERLRGY